ncbi:MAG: type II/IV secretion system protein [Bdellovibrio sp.]|nr:type II/IV secretion system protein [Bdellovibrio sp.]
MVKSLKLARFHPFVSVGKMGLKHPTEAKTILDTEWLTQWFAGKIGIPYIDIDPLKLDIGEITKLLPKAFIKRIAVLPVQVTSTKVVFATSEPFDRDWLLDTAASVKRDIEIVLGNPEKITRYIEEFFEVRSAMNQVGDSGNDFGDQVALDKMVGVDKGEFKADDGNVAKIVDWVFQFANTERATDIHLEPREGQAQMRFRIDGNLRVVYKFDPKVFIPVLSRLKIIADLKVDEKRRPQDGRIKRQVGDKLMEMRISTIPTHHGEKMVIRIFDTNITTKTFEELGLSAEDIKGWENLVSRSFGLILVTGPTGSGKTTTLQTSLSFIAAPDINICTIEDPIEIVNDQLAQMQVNSEINLSFGNAIRAFLRQDPDVIMVGEIRDQDTAEMAIQASLTGHLVLSTLHTNSALASITRLIDLKVEPHLLSASLIGLMAQRLVRVLCPHCKEKAPPNLELWKALIGPYNVPTPAFVYHAKGCRECRNTGYYGRIIVYELVRVTPELRELIRPGITLQEIENLMRGKYLPIRLNAVQKVLQGKTSIEEVVTIVI